jgi:tetratricopeptide (TPR) repeat protein
VGAHNWLGVVYEQKNEPLPAIHEFERAIALKPDYVWAHNNLASVVIRTGEMGDLPGAREKLTGVLQLDANYVQAQNLFGFALGQQGDLAGALDHLNRAIQLDPKFAQAHYAGGGSLVWWTKSAGAVQTLSAIKRKPTHIKPPRITRCLISLY